MARKASLRLVVDTNLWISFLISNRLRQLDALLVAGELRFSFSVELLEELAATIAKPKIKKYFPPQALEEMLTALESYIEIVPVQSATNICRDPKDNFLLDLAKDGKADYLLTGDKDLLALEQFKKTKIVTISSFLAR